ncbi:DNA methyltransferase [Lentilactobacillus parabuchneri]
MQVAEQKKAAKKFSEDWKGQGYEKGQSQAFWIALLSDVLGVKDPAQYIEFEDEVHLDKTSFIDGYIPKTHVLIEQKGINKDLNKGIRQSDGSFLTPFQQAKRYSANLPYSKRPRWIVTSNFKEFNIYDMEKPIGEPIKLMLADLPKQYYLLDFLVDQTNVEIKKETNVSVKAGDLVGKIYDELKKQYKDPDNDHSQRSINQLCVRFVFCLYAEDAGIFGQKDMFHDYLKDIEPRFMRRSIIDLFQVLDTKIPDRDPYLDDQLAQFPYVNGGLFSEEDIEIPNFTQELKDLLLNDASADFDWSDISPTIFGAVFESTLNPDTRREGGMHYTSIENIHKVIDPLFLDDLKEELLQIKQYKQPATLREKAKQFQFKLSKLTFFDPACGSGNFLTETYLSLRKLENEAIKLAFGDQSMLDVGQGLIKVSIQQFYGIEINDFAVSVAKTALWIAESQMMEATKAIVYANIDFLPLKTYTKIVEGNALRVDWNRVVPNYKLTYMISNPPFSGARVMKKKQKDELHSVFGNAKGIGDIDYVSGWYKKASDFMNNTTIHTAFVSTNSITQGQQVNLLWKPLFDDGIHINFAYTTFRWNSEATQKAQVHVVIISFSYVDEQVKRLYSGNHFRLVDNINGYLADSDNVFILNCQIKCNTTLKNIS